MPETVKSELFPSAVGIEITRPVNRLRLFLSPLDKGHFITAFLNRISMKGAAIIMGEMKKEGMTIRQIERLTGSSRGPH